MSRGRAELRDVHFRYAWRRRDVLQGISWAPRSGRTVILGPNGAGKSTLLRICAGILSPTSGQIVGLSSATELSDAPGVGYMPQSVHAIRGLSCREQVAYAGWLQGQSKREAWKQAEFCLATVGLTMHSAERAQRLSGGQLRRLGLAEAIIGGPRTLILDEPTVGLDPRERARFRSILNEVASIASTIIVSTHQVDDSHIRLR